MDKILNKKKVGKKILYLVKWDGYSDKEATWEPVSNLKNIKEVIREYDSKTEKQRLLDQLE